jgi:hypothetical protein
MDWKWHGYRSGTTYTELMDSMKLIYLMNLTYDTQRHGKLRFGKISSGIESRRSSVNNAFG